MTSPLTTITKPKSAL